jgi:hypothetical protein
MMTATSTGLPSISVGFISNNFGHMFYMTSGNGLPSCHHQNLLEALFMIWQNK